MIQPNPNVHTPHSCLRVTLRTYESREKLAHLPTETPAESRQVCLEWALTGTPGSPPAGSVLAVTVRVQNAQLPVVSGPQNHPTVSW